MKSLGLQVSISLLDKLTAPLGTVQKSVLTTNDKLNQMQNALGSTEAWRKQKKAAQESSAALLRTKSSLVTLGREMQQAAAQSETMQGKLASSTETLKQLDDKAKKARLQVASLRDKMALAKEMKLPKEDIQALNKELMTARTEAGHASRAFTDFRKSNTALKKEVKASITVEKQATTAYKKTEQTVKSQQAAHKANLQAVRKSSEAMKAHGIESGNLSSKIRALKADIGNLNSTLKKEEDQLARVADRTKKLTKIKKELSGNQALAANVSFVGAAVSQTGNRLLGSVTPSISAAANFDQSISNLGAVAIKTPDNALYHQELAKLEAAARKLGNTTVFSASQAAEGMKFLGMAGFDTNQIITAMPDVLNLAAAGATDLGRASDIASDIMSGFNLKSTDMTRISDVLTATFTSSNTTLEMLGETMKFVAPEARGVGMSLEQTAAAAGLLANVGIKGSMAGTALRSMISSLSAPTAKAAKVLDTLKIKTKTAKGDLRDIPTLMADLSKATASMGSADRKASFTAVFGIEAGTAAAELIDKQGVKGAIDSFTAMLMDSQGMAARVAQRQNDNGMGSFKLLMSSVESLQISMGHLLMPQIIWVSETLTSLAKWTENLIEKHGTLATFIGNGILIVGGLAVAGGAAITAVAALGGAAALLSAGFKILGINAKFAGTSLRNRAKEGLPDKLGKLGGLAAAIPVAYELSSMVDFGGWVYDVTHTKPVQQVPVQHKQQSNQLNDNSTTHINITTANNNNPQAIKDAVLQALDDHKQQQASRVDGLMLDYKGAY